MCVVLCKRADACIQTGASESYRTRNFDNEFADVLLTLVSSCRMLNYCVGHAHIYSWRKAAQGLVPWKARGR